MSHFSVTRSTAFTFTKKHLTYCRSSDFTQLMNVTLNIIKRFKLTAAVVSQITYRQSVFGSGANISATHKSVDVQPLKRFKTRLFRFFQEVLSHTRRSVPTITTTVCSQCTVAY